MTTSALRNRAAEASGEQPSTEVATFAGEPSASIAQFIQTMQPELGRALPKGLDADRMARLALTAIRKDPNLARCTPASFAGSLLTAAALGLEVGTTGEAYLAPYGRECSLIVGYQGYSKLFWQSPLAKHLDCQTVYSNDEFDYAYGLGQYLRHKPAKGNRGDVVYYYAVAELNTGGSAFVVLTPDEVKALRQGKVGPQGNIADPMRWMERKTALRQLLKMMPRSTTLNMAIEVDEKFGTELYHARVEEVRATTPAADAPALEQGRDQESGQEAAGWDGEEPPMTDPQRRAMFGNFSKLNITDEDQQRKYLSDVLGRTVTSRGSLTLVECQQVLEAQDMDLRDPGAES